MNKLLKTRLKKFTSPWVVFAIDMMLIAGAYIVAYYLRNNYNILLYLDEVLAQLPIIMIVYASFVLLIKSHKGVIRYTNSNDMFRIALAMTTATVFLFFLDLLLMMVYPNSIVDFKRSTILIHFFLNINFLVFSRLLYVYLFNKMMGEKKPDEKKILIYGAGEMGLLLKDALLQQGPPVKIDIVGFVDDNKSKTGKRINNITIHHPKQITEKYTKRHQIKEVYIAINNISVPKLRTITKKFLKLGVKAKLVPSINEWVNGDLNVTQIKDVRIEELLSREMIALDTQFWTSRLSDQVIMVTGGAGSIGSEIVRQLLNFPIQKLLIVDHSESSLYNLEQELIRKSKKNFIPIVQDVCHESSMHQIFETYKPNIIFHAAAYKHVPLMEKYPKQALKTNLKGAKIVSDLAVKFKVERFVMVSTDKAVNPTNIMGATKRAAEMYITALAQKNVHTKFMTTRFGNVLGSNGSVIPLFKKQIENGGPVTVTHKDIIRYFMTITEASQLVIEAGISGNGGEVFVFDMGEPVKIFDLAVNIIQLSGFSYPDEIDIKITGLRPGEKLFEELLSHNENNLPTHHQKIKIAKVYVGDSIKNINQINQILTNSSNLPEIKLVSLLKDLVPEYKSQNSRFEKIDLEEKSISKVFKLAK